MFACKWVRVIQLVVNSPKPNDLISKSGGSILQRFCLPIIMAEERLKEVQLLMGRLKEARREAELLKEEVASIQQRIDILIDSTVFENYSNNSRESCQTDSVKGPPSKKFKCDLSTEDGHVIVYTDGACENNGRPNAKAGVGVWFGPEHPLNISKPVEGKATNNVAEIQACIAAIEIARENGISKLKIVTDSQFTINCMTQWIQRWKKNNWKLANKDDVKNQKELKELDRLCHLISVKWQHVDGHKGIPGNEAADQLARNGARFYKSS